MVNRRISPEMERGIGLGLLVGTLLALLPFELSPLYVFNVLITKLGLELPALPSSVFFVFGFFILYLLIFILGIGLLIGIGLGKIFKKMECEITPWTFRKKVLIILVAFNILSAYTIIYCSFTWCHGFELLGVIEYNFAALLSIGLVAVYDRLKLRRLKSLDSR